MNILGIGAFVLWLLWGAPYKMTLRPGEPAVTSIQNSKRYTHTDIQAVRVERHRSRNRVSYVPPLDPADGKKVYLGWLGGAGQYLWRIATLVGTGTVNRNWNKADKDCYGK